MWKEKLTNTRTLISVVALSSLATGSALGYLIASKRLSLKYENLANQEIEQVKKHYALRNKEGMDLGKMAAKYEGVVEGLGYVQTHPALEPVLDRGDERSKELIEEGKRLAALLDEAEEVEESKNIFENGVENDFNHEKEEQRRTERPNDPYIITADEFSEGDRDYHQVSLTYYEGDEVLCDDQDQIVTESDKTVGDENLGNFGYGSNDPNVVYIRNERLSIDIEILRSDGKYAKEVLGFDDGELKHSDRRPRKFRDYDE